VYKGFLITAIPNEPNKNMTIQSSVEIGNVIRNAVVFNVKNWLGDTMNTDSILESVEKLFALLKAQKIEYVLVGGIALLHYVEGRNTEDLDIIMALSSLEKLPEIRVIRQDMYFVRGEYGSLQIDILLTKNPLFKKVQQKYTIVQHFLNQDIPFATVDGLLLLKLYALPSLYRQGNFVRVGIYENDIATLMHYYSPDMPKLMKEISSYVSKSDIVEITNIVSDIEQRIKRFQKGAS
jgi:predicted nucleotidyltransferase